MKLNPVLFYVTLGPFARAVIKAGLAMLRFPRQAIEALSRGMSHPLAIRPVRLHTGSQSLELSKLGLGSDGARLGYTGRHKIRSAKLLANSEGNYFSRHPISSSTRRRK